MKPVEQLYKWLPEKVADNLILQAFALTKVPMITFAGVKITRADDQGIDVVIPLTRRTKNHLQSMYFGALMVGADCAAGFLAARLIYRKSYPVTFVFKDVSAEFLKRPEGDVLFRCDEGERITALVEEAMASGERVNIPVEVLATVPKIDPDEVVARISLTLSLKRKSKRTAS